MQSVEPGLRGLWNLQIVQEELAMGGKVLRAPETLSRRQLLLF